MGEKIAFETGKAAELGGPYSQAVIHNRQIFPQGSAGKVLHTGRENPFRDASRNRCRRLYLNWRQRSA